MSTAGVSVRDTPGFRGQSGGSNGMIDMTDLELSANTVAATGLWLVAVGAVILSFWVMPGPLSSAGIICAIGGATVIVRGFFCGLARREQAAFDLGRECGRARSLK